MTDDERYTFSSLMTLLIENEAKLKDLYEKNAEATSEPTLKSLLSDFGKGTGKRIDMMQRARVESVVEMALEPITGLKLAELLAKIDTITESKSLTDLEKVAAVEGMTSELYARASPKIMHMSADAGELLMALSHQSEQRKHQLDGYVGSA